MLIVGESLQQLVRQFEIVDERCFDQNSLTLTLDKQIIKLQPPDRSEATVLSYGQEIPDSWVKREHIQEQGLVLSPKTSVLACSHETVTMPIGYFGFVQTKGSLARLFVTVNCCDAQIEGGFTGKITFEILNLAPFSVRLHHNQPVAQLFVFKTSTKLAKPYRGRYLNVSGPTIQLPDRP